MCWAPEGPSPAALSHHMGGPRRLRLPRLRRVPPGPACQDGGPARRRTWPLNGFRLCARVAGWDTYMLRTDENANNVGSDWAKHLQDPHKEFRRGWRAAGTHIRTKRPYQTWLFETGNVTRRIHAYSLLAVQIGLDQSAPSSSPATAGHSSLCLIENPM